MPDNDQPLEVYADAMRIAINPYGAAFVFGLNEPSAPKGVPETKDKVVLRMSLEHAKVMAMMLRRNLKQYERDNKLEIPLPYQLYTALGIAREDWQDGGASG